jgi:putative peptide zinc metalloprotease protein
MPSERPRASPSLFSALWYRVAALAPRWRVHVRVDRQPARGETWHVLSQGASGRSLRIDAAAWAIVGRCDGSTPLQIIWQARLDEDAEHAPTQDEVIALVSQLVADGFLECASWPDIEAVVEHDAALERRRRMQRLSPLALRIGLGDPSRWLRPLDALARLAFSPAGALAWLLLVAWGAGHAIAQADELLRHAARWAGTPRYWLLAWLCYAPVKLLHEAAHALAVRRFGGAVREAGIGLLMGFPAPYVDASEAERFPSHAHRALVSGAGILAELALAALAVVLWQASEPGWVRDLAFTVAIIGSTSTLLFNANPLVRMDGYYLMCDALQLPNLAARSGASRRAQLLARVLGLDEREAPRSAPGERRWLIAYAPAAWLYRAGVCAWLVVWAGSLHRLAGLALAAASVGWLFVLPALHALREARATPATWHGHRRAGRRAALAVAVLAALAAVPVPDRSVSAGIVWVPDEARVRAHIDGFVAGIDLAHASPVQPDDPLMRLDDPALRSERERLLGRKPGLDTQLFSSLRVDPARSRQVEEALLSLDSEVRRIDERLAQLSVTAPSAGRIGWARPDDLPGRFVKQGETLGYVLGDRPPVIRVALAQDEAARLAQGAHAVEVRLAEAPGDALPATLLRDAPAPASKLPSSALADRFGGPIVVDPSDADALKPAQPTFLIDVALADPQAAGIGARAWVRFDHGAAPLALQALRWMRQTVRTRFSSDEI